MTMLHRVLIMCISLAAVGCSSNLSRFQMPDSDLGDIVALHIDAPDAEERNAEEIRSLVATNLENRGYRVETRDPSATLGEGDYVFDIAADWHWDITWYLLELRVAIYEPEGNILVAQAQSQQSSLVRKSIEEVVERAMATLFNDPTEEEEGE